MRGTWWLAVLVGCASPTLEPDAADNFGETEDRGDEACDNLAGEHCMMPFPSDVWRDAATGRVALPEAAMPRSSGGARMSTAAFNDKDGFGAASPVLFQLPGATLTGAPAAFDPSPSVTAESLTVLLDATTGERIPHWLEPDWLDVEADPQVYVLRPAVPLPRGHRVIAAVRGLVDAEGAPVEAPAPFAALRDGGPSRWFGVHARRARYERDIFPALEDAGFPREDLQLAWDFTVASDRSLDTLTWMAEDLYAALDTTPPAWTVDRIETMNDPNIAFVVHATLEIPSFVGAANENGLRRLRDRDDSGRVVAAGVERWPFRLQIPHSALDGAGEVPVLSYGHGFLGSLNEADNGWLRDMAQRYRFAIVATSYQGMSDGNLPVWISTLTADAGSFPLISHEAMQGTMNHLALQRLLRSGALDALPELQTTEGAPLLDRDTLWYYGNSQGGTQGALVNALTRDVSRSVLGVPGAAYPFLLQRSVVFNGYAAVISAIYPDEGDVSLFLALAGTGMDDFDPLGFAPRIVSADKQTLLHVAREDAQVHNQVSFLLGRTVAAVQPVETVRAIWGLESGEYPIDSPAAVVEFDFGVPEDTTPYDPPVSETDTHGTLRRDLAGQEQMMTFLRTGRVEDTCGGACFR